MADKKQDDTQRTTLRDAFSFAVIFVSCGYTLRYLYRYNFGIKNVDVINNLRAFLVAAIIYYVAFIFGLVGYHLAYLLGLCVAAYIAHFSYTHARQKQKLARPRHTGTSVFSLIPVLGKNDALISMMLEPAAVFAIGTALYHQFDIGMGGTYLLVASLLITAIFELFEGSSRNASINETLALARSSMQTNKVDTAKQFIIDETPDAVIQERKRIMDLLRN